MLLAQNEVELIDSPQTRIGTPATNYLVNDNGVLTLLPNTTIDTTSGNWFAVAQTFEFSPGSDSTVHGDTAIVITFSEPMDTTTIDSGISVSSSTDSLIAGSWSSMGSQLTFLPITGFTPFDTITVHIYDSLLGMFGVWKPVNYSWDFFTSPQPFFVSPQDFLVHENDSIVGRSEIRYSPMGTSPIYTISGGEDASLFSINSSTGNFNFVSPPNFEQPADNDFDGIYTFQIRASTDLLVNGTMTAFEVFQDVSITIQDVNEPPIIQSPELLAIDENDTIVLQIDALDPDTAIISSLSYSLTGGVDQNFFSISDSGLVFFNVAPDFEIANDLDSNNIYLVTLEVTDSVNQVQQNLEITINDLNDESPVITSDSSANVDENNTFAMQILANDPDGGTTLVYSLENSTNPNESEDNTLFAIDSTGLIAFITAPDFENPVDNGSDNIYRLFVQVSDGLDSVEQAISITVIDVNEPPVFITSPSFTLQENNAFSSTIVAADNDLGTTLTYSIQGGEDQAKFSITPQGLLTTDSAMNYESESFDGDDIYEVIVRVTDGVNHVQDTFSLEVLDVVEFITIWKTDNPGNTPSNQIRLPLLSPGKGIYNFTVYWGDGSSQQVLAMGSGISHSYSNPGTYEVSIVGHIEGWSFQSPTYSDAKKLIEVKNWGSLRLGIEYLKNQQPGRYFEGCTNLQITATDTLNTAGMANMESTFMDCQSLTTVPNIELWDMSSVESIRRFFRGAISFNQDLAGWNVSAAKDMSETFMNAYSFDQNLGAWHIGSASDLGNMFHGISLSTSNYDSTLIGWVQKGVNPQISFGGPNTLVCVGGIARQYLIDSRGWTIVDGGIPDIIPDLVTLPVIRSDSAIMSIAPPTASSGCTAILTATTSTTFPITDCTEITWVFTDVTGKQLEQKQLVMIDAFTLKWKTSASGSKSQITIGHRSNPSFLGNFYYNYMVDWGDSTYNIGRTGDVTHVYNSPSGTIKTVSICGEYPNLEGGTKENIQSIEHWGSIIWRNWYGNFSGISNLQITATDVPDLGLVSNMELAFEGAGLTGLSIPTINQWDVTNVTNMKRMFDNSGFDGDLSNWNVSNVTDMSWMFRNSLIASGGLGAWGNKTSKVTQMRGMFENATNFNEDISSWSQENLHTASSMFAGASSFNQNLASWDVDSVYTVAQMFDGASSFDQNLGNWKLSSTSGLGRMFANSGMSIASYDSTLAGWANNNPPSNFVLNSEGLKYCDQGTHDLLEANYGWTIINDTLSTSCGPSSRVTTEEVAGIVNDPSDIEGLNLYPNPAGQYFMLELENYEKVWVTLSNLQGQILAAPVELKNRVTKFDLSGIRDHLLFLHLDQPDGSVTLAVIRQDQ